MVLDLYRDKIQGEWGVYMRNEILVVFEWVQDDVKVPMRKENSPSQEEMSLFPCQFLDPLNQIRSEMRASKLLNEFVVIDLLVIGGGDWIWIDLEIIILILLDNLFGLFRFLLLSCDFFLFLFRQLHKSKKRSINQTIFFYNLNLIEWSVEINIFI